jgi:hypothetical protein
MTVKVEALPNVNSTYVEPIRRQNSSPAIFTGTGKRSSGITKSGVAARKMAETEQREK